MALLNFLSQEEIRNKILNKWKTMIPNIATESDSQIYMDADALAEAIFASQVDAFALAEEAFIAYATGDRLSNLGLERGVPRREAAYSSGEVTFSRTTKASVDYPIPVGTEISTQPSATGTTHNFKTTTAVTLIGSITNPTNLQISTIGSGGALPDATTYYYKITAIDALGNSTISSNEVSVETGSVGGISSNSLTWNSVTGAVSYKIYVSNSTGTETLLTSTTEVFFIHTTGLGDGSNTPALVNNTGATSITVEVEAILADSDSNVPSGTVTKLVDEPAGIESVTNASPMEGGADVEDDDTYRNRMQLGFIYGTAQSKTTVTGYEQTALSIAGVKTSKYVNPNIGSARNLGYIYITSTETSSGLPSATLLSRVQDEINLDDNRSPNDYIEVLAPTAVSINITVELITLETGYDAASVQASVEEALDTYIQGLGVGDNVLVVNISNAVHDVTGVVDFIVTTPSANIVISDTQKAITGIINIIV